MSLDSAGAAEVRAALEAMHPDSYGWALACAGRDRDAAQDILQRAYLRILSGRARFRGKSSFRTFVFGVIRMVAREERRDRERDTLRATSPGSDIVDASRLPDAEVTAQEQRTLLLQALSQLSERQREVLELVFYHDLTIAEAAVVMHVGVGSARTHYERGKARLRALLSPELTNHE